MNRRRISPATESGEGKEGAAPQDELPASQPPMALGWSPRDLLVPYILLAVSLQRTHGYLIEEYLKSLGFQGIEKSLLYRTLRGLEKDGLLFSTWEMGSAGPARRVYTLTAAGQAWLSGGIAALESYRSMIDRFFALYTAGSEPTQASLEPEPTDEDQTEQAD